MQTWQGCFSVACFPSVTEIAIAFGNNHKHFKILNHIRIMVCLISKSKSALHYVLLSLWVIHLQHKKKVIPIFDASR